MGESRRWSSRRWAAAIVADRRRRVADRRADRRDPQSGVRPPGSGDVVVVPHACDHRNPRRTARGDLRTRPDATPAPPPEDIDAPTRNGGIAGLLSFFAVGCPVCNKLVIVALGATGARQWFEPVQPLLAVASVALLAWALRARLRSGDTCRI